MPAWHRSRPLVNAPAVFSRMEQAANRSVGSTSRKTNYSKAGGPKPALNSVYNNYFVVSFVVLKCSASSSLRLEHSSYCSTEKGPAITNSGSGHRQYSDAEKVRRSPIIIKLDDRVAEEPKHYIQGTGNVLFRSSRW